jgi:hypothetical protein
MKIKAARPTTGSTGGEYGLGMRDHAGRWRAVPPKLQTGDVAVLRLHEAVSPHAGKTQLVSYTFAGPVQRPREVCRQLEVVTRSYFLPGVEFYAYPYLSYLHGDKHRLEYNEEYGCRDMLTGRQVQPVLLPRQQYQVLLLQEGLSHWLGEVSPLSPERRKLIAVEKRAGWSPHRLLEAETEARLAQAFQAAEISSRADVVSQLKECGLPVIAAAAHRLTVSAGDTALRLVGPYCDARFAGPEFIAEFRAACERQYQRFHGDPAKLLRDLQEAQRARVEDLAQRLGRPLAAPSLAGRDSLHGRLETIRELQGREPILRLPRISAPRRAAAKTHPRQEIERRILEAFPHLAPRLSQKKPKRPRKIYEQSPEELLPGAPAGAGAGVLETLRSQGQRTVGQLDSCADVARRLKQTVQDTDRALRTFEARLWFPQPAPAEPGVGSGGTAERTARPAPGVSDLGRPQPAAGGPAEEGGISSRGLVEEFYRQRLASVRDLVARLERAIGELPQALARRDRSASDRTPAPASTGTDAGGFPSEHGRHRTGFGL